jgi:hypothetical protein
MSKNEDDNDFIVKYSPNDLIITTTRAASSNVTKKGIRFYY